MHALRATYDEEMRRDADVPGMRREEGAGTVRYLADDDGGEGVVLFSRLDAAGADAAIAVEVARFRELGVAFEWKLHDYDEPPDLAARLAAAGFTEDEPETLVVLDLARLPARLDPAGPAGAVDVRAVTDPDGLAPVAAVQADAFGATQEWLLRALAAEMRAVPDRIGVFVAYADGAPAAAGWVRTCPGRVFAGLWGGGTRARFRGRGLYTALVAARCRHALERGARHALVDAGPASLPILERLGFRPLARIRPHRWRPA